MRTPERETTGNQLERSDRMKTKGERHPSPIEMERVPPACPRQPASSTGAMSDRMKKGGKEKQQAPAPEKEQKQGETPEAIQRRGKARGTIRPPDGSGKSTARPVPRSTSPMITQER